MPLTREQRARAILAGIGASNLNGESGTIHVNIPTSHTARVLEETESEITPPLISGMRPQIISQVLDRAAIARDFRFRSILEKPCIKYIDPAIDYTVSPIKIKNVKYHVFSCYLEGDIVNKISNSGTEGQKGTTTVRRWEDCPVSDESYTWERVAKSADLISNWSHELKEKTTGAKFGSVSQNVSVPRGMGVSKTVHWKSGSLWDFIVQILNILITGGVTTRNGYDITVTYEWKGSQTKSKHIDKTVWLPIEGDIIWYWD